MYSDECNQALHALLEVLIACCPPSCWAKSIYIPHSKSLLVWMDIRTVRTLADTHSPGVCLRLLTLRGLQREPLRSHLLTLKKLKYGLIRYKYTAALSSQSSRSTSIPSVNNLGCRRRFGPERRVLPCLVLRVRLPHAVKDMMTISGELPRCDAITFRYPRQQQYQAHTRTLPFPTVAPHIAQHFYAHLGDNAGL